MTGTFSWAQIDDVARRVSNAKGQLLKKIEMILNIINLLTINGSGYHEVLVMMTVVANYPSVKNIFLSE